VRDRVNLFASTNVARIVVDATHAPETIPNEPVRGVYMFEFLFNVLILPVLRFFVNAFALKTAVGVLSKPGADNQYGTAVTLSALLALLGVAFGFIPFVGGLLHMVAWVIVVRMVYDLTLTRSIGVGVLQWGLGVLLMWGLKLIGIGAIA
jgi:hypothetical protein